MIKQVVQFIIGADGTIINYNSIPIRAHSNLSTRLQVVMPISTNTSMRANFVVLDSTYSNLQQYMIPTGLKGADVVEKTSQFYELSKGWAVFEADLSSNILSHIAKYRAGRVGVAFSLSNRVPSEEATNFVGYFGAGKELPVNPQYGDYVICDTYNYILNDIVYNKGDILVFVDFWKIDGIVPVLATETTMLSVDSSITYSEVNVDKDAVSIMLSEMASLIAQKQDKNDLNLQTESKTVVGGINELNSKKQDKTDQALTTVSKNVVGGINELKTATDNLRVDVNKNTQDISQNKTDISYLFQHITLSENYVGLLKSSAMPTTAELDAFVQTIEGRARRNGDVILFTLELPEESDKNYKYKFGGDGWDYYELPASQPAMNDELGLVKGTFYIGNENALQVDIVDGVFENIFIKDAEGNLRNIVEYVNGNALLLSELSTTILNIISGDITVGNSAKLNNKTESQLSVGNSAKLNNKEESELSVDNSAKLNNKSESELNVNSASRATRDGLDNVISDHYLDKESGATKMYVKDYAMPRVFNQVFYLASTGYVESIPTTPPSGIQFEKTISEFGDQEILRVKRIFTENADLSNRNSTTNNFWLSSTGDIDTEFRLITRVRKAEDVEWTNLSVQLSENVFLPAESMYNLKFNQTMTSLEDKSIHLEVGDEFEQILEIASETSEERTFYVYSNTIRPSAFYFNSQNIIADVNMIGEPREIFVPQNAFALNTDTGLYEASIPQDLHGQIVGNKYIISGHLAEGATYRSVTLDFTVNSGGDITIYAEQPHRFRILIASAVEGRTGEHTKLRTLTVLENGKYVSEIGEAFDTVNVLVPPPVGTKNNVTITELPQATIQTVAGKKLEDITISGGVAMFSEWRVTGAFTWTYPDTVVDSTGSYPALFVPDDTENFNSAVLNILVTVTSTPPFNSGILQIVRQIGISDPAWTKVGDNALLVANANKLLSVPEEFVPARDDYFDDPTVPVYSKIKILNISDETGEIVSYLGDPDFRWDGSNNTSVYTYYPSFWFRRRKVGDAEEVAISEEPLEGGAYIKAFITATFWQKWETITLPDSSTKQILRSYAGIRPDTFSIDGGVNTARTRARATLGGNASGGDWRAILIGWLHVVKYGTNDIQNVIASGINSPTSTQTGVGNAHATLLGRDGYIGYSNATSIWSLGICDFYSQNGWLMDGIYSTGVDNKVRIATDPSKFVQHPTVTQEGYTELDYDISYNTGYTTTVGIDQTNENPLAQLIALRVNGDTNASSSTGTTDSYDYSGTFRYSIYAGSQHLSNSPWGRGVFGFAFKSHNGSYTITGAVRATLTL